MLKVVKTVKEHIDKIKLQPEQAEEFVDIDIEGMHSIVDDNGNVFALWKGIIWWQGRGTIRAFISADSGKHFVAIVRIFKILYKEYAPERLEAEVCDSFDKAKKFVEFFGFKKESVMKKYFAGKDYCMYVKMKGEEK